MSALSGLAENPERVNFMFEDQKINKEGLYFVKLFIDGVLRYIIIDDRFPVDHKGNSLFSKPKLDRKKNKEIWVMLVEKAYAKIFGYYSALQLGLNGESLNTFTGAPTEDINTSNPNFWKELY